MAKIHKLAGLTRAEPNFARQELTFDLQMDEEQKRRICLTASRTVVEQIIAGLAKVTTDMRARGRRLKAEIVTAEPVTAHLVRRDPGSETILLQLVTAPGVFHTFALQRDRAADIAAELRSHIASAGPVGRA